MLKSCQHQMTLFVILGWGSYFEKRLAFVTRWIVAKLQITQKLLDNGLILQGEYDKLSGDFRISVINYFILY